jgi:hypothetical protein
MQLMLMHHDLNATQMSAARPTPTGALLLLNCFRVLIPGYRHADAIHPKSVVLHFQPVCRHLVAYVL